MIVSDLLRAALVLLIPIAAVTNVWLVYPLVFLITSISIFFRPARVAILPRIVDEDDLLTANSAMWVGETHRRRHRLPARRPLRRVPRPALPLAFWIDAATYVASAVLHRLDRRAADRPSGRGRRPTARRPDATPRPRRASRRAARAGVSPRLREGWRFLRHEPVLLANTIQGTVAQFALGVFTALTPIFVAASVIDRRRRRPRPATYAFLRRRSGSATSSAGSCIGLSAHGSRRAAWSSPATSLFGAARVRSSG